MSEPKPGEVYFEHVRLGAFAKCTAVDAATGVEVSVSGPVSALPGDLETLALRALKRRLAQLGEAG